MGPRLLRFYELIWELMLEQDARHREQLKDMPNDDLETLVNSQIVEAIQREPQLAINAARKLGWEIVPQAAKS